MEVAGQRKLLRLGGAEGGNAGNLQRQPQPHRPEMPGQLGRQVRRRRPDLGLAERADIFAAGAERLLQQLAVADERRAGSIWQEQRLVRIKRDAVGQLDAAQQAAALVAQGEQPAVGAVGVEPGAVVAAELRDLGQRVDRARIDRPGGGNDKPRPAAVLVREPLLRSAEAGRKDRACAARTSSSTRRSAPAWHRAAE